MPPASSGGTPSGESSFSSTGEDDNDDDRERETREGKGSDSISLLLRHGHHHHLPLASTSSPADDAAAASALSAALLPLLPPASAAWAYGSGVFSQQVQQQQQQRIPRDPATMKSASGPPPNPRPSVDLLLAVADPRRWHKDNLRRNPHHYSPLARGSTSFFLGGPSGICWLAERVGPGVWFNSGVRVVVVGGGGEEGARAADSDSDPGSRSTLTLKYGVFSEGALLADLESWGELYLAGRLQKPTLRLPTTETETTKAATTTEPDDLSFASRLEAALEGNVAAALAAALLLLPPTFSHSRLLSALVSLSYSGDVRVAAAAEDPMKVERIVAGTGRARLDRLYSRHLPFPPPSPPSSSSSSSNFSSNFSASSSSSSSSSSSFPVASAAGLVPLCGGNAWAQDPRGESRRELLALLPERVRRKVEEKRRSGGASSSFSSFSSSRKGPSYFSSSPSPSLLASSVRAALASTVRSSSARAALVGLVSAGPAGAVSFLFVFFFIFFSFFSGKGRRGRKKTKRTKKNRSLFPFILSRFFFNHRETGEVRSGQAEEGRMGREELGSPGRERVEREKRERGRKRVDEREKKNLKNLKNYENQKTLFVLRFFFLFCTRDGDDLYQHSAMGGQRASPSPPPPPPPETGKRQGGGKRKKRIKKKERRNKNKSSQQLQPPRELVHLPAGPQHRQHRPRPGSHLRPPCVGDNVRRKPQPPRPLCDREQPDLVVDAKADLGRPGLLPGFQAVVAGPPEPLVEADGLESFCWCFC